jgi:hypothetical protein
VAHGQVGPVNGVADLAARLVGGCAWGLIALVVSGLAVAVYLSPFLALWWLLP